MTKLMKFDLVCRIISDPCSEQTNKTCGCRHKRSLSTLPQDGSTPRSGLPNMIEMPSVISALPLFVDVRVCRLEKLGSAGDHAYHLILLRFQLESP